MRRCGAASSLPRATWSSTARRRAFSRRSMRRAARSYGASKPGPGSSLRQSPGSRTASSTSPWCPDGAARCRCGAATSRRKLTTSTRADRSGCSSSTRAVELQRPVVATRTLPDRRCPDAWKRRRRTAATNPRLVVVQAAIERVAADPELPGGRRHVAVVLLERALDRLARERCEIRLGHRSASGDGGPERGVELRRALQLVEKILRHVLTPQLLLARGHDERRAQDVRELADVALPRMPLEQGHQVGGDGRDEPAARFLSQDALDEHADVAA